MYTIHKYPLDVADSQEIEMPEGSRILKVAIQHGVPCLWALVDPTEPSMPTSITTKGTGHNIDRDIGRYIDTYQLDGGALVFHVFES